MIATGTDVKPLEVLLFMRDVKSINYFEQMKGRGTRTIKFDDLQKVTRTAKHTKNALCNCRCDRGCEIQKRPIADRWSESHLSQ